MINAIKKTLKWAVIVASIAALVRWIKGKRSSNEEEEYPGLAEPWPPLDNSSTAEASESEKSSSED